MSVTASISNILGTAPAELVSYFELGQLITRPETNVNCLPFPKALEYTQAVHQMARVAGPMGLFVLDDAEDSNPYCYISRGPCAGAVMHLFHDDTPRIEFRSLHSFLTALRNLPEEEWLDELKPETPLDFDTAAEIGRIMVESPSELDAFASAYLAVTGSLPETLKEKLATHDDFFVREAFAEWLLRCGTSTDESLVSQLAADRVDQVARPATKALQRTMRPP